MAQMNRRTARRQRHLKKGGGEGSGGGGAGGRGERQFATAGEERGAVRNPSSGDLSRDPKTLAQAMEEGEPGFGKTYGQGFGVGAGRGVESSASGLEGASGRERDYRGNAGTTFGAVVGPDALKEDTREDDQRRRDPKPEEGEPGK